MGRSAARRRAFAFALMACLATAGAAHGAEALPPKEALAKAEMQFLETKFDEAIETLKTSLAACTPATCSKKERARLHVGVGLVLAAGKRRLEDAKDAFLQALDLDPNASPNKELVTEEVDYAYSKARRELGLGPPGEEPEPKEEPKPEPKEEKEQKDGDDDDDDAPAVEEDDLEGVAFDGDPNFNWFSLTFATDVTVLSSDADICTRANQNENHYVCAREDGSRYDGQPTLGNGNNLNAGPALATLRLMLGYDRILADNFSVGARLGIAFLGANQGDASFIPLHLEARAGYWFLDKPFEMSRFRPHLHIAAGFAQVDTKIGDVEVLEDGQACGASNPGAIDSQCTQPTGQDPTRVEPRVQTLSGYKQAGNGFAAAGLGLAVAPIPLMQINLTFRAGLTFPIILPLLQPQLGVEFGF